jgi:N-acetyl-beta-hexosaminidase
MAKEEKKDKKESKHGKTNGYHTTTVRHFTDGTHHVKHEHEDGSAKEYARGSHDEMIDGMLENLSGPGPEELDAASGKHGVPADIAKKAGLREDSGHLEAE